VTPLFVVLLLLGLEVPLIAPSAEQGPVLRPEWQARVVHAVHGAVVDLGKREVAPGVLPPPTQPITIRGGVFKEFTLERWRNVTFENSRFVATPEAPEHAFAMRAIEPSALTFRGCEFRGFRNQAGRLIGRLLLVSGGDKIVVERTSFRDAYGGIQFVRTTGLIFSGNQLKSLREGINLVGGRNIRLTGNVFSEFEPWQGDHSDAVQFFTASLNRPNDTAARNVVIQDNVIWASGGVQGIFVSDEAQLFLSGRGYADFLIKNNLILNARWHGITLNRVRRAYVENNRLWRMGEAPFKNRLTIKDSEATVKSNEADEFLLQDGNTQARNRIGRPRSRRDALMASSRVTQSLAFQP